MESPAQRKNGNTRSDLPEPPKEASRYALDVLEQQADLIRTAPDGTQEETLNRGAYRIGQLVGARAIGADDARSGLEIAAAEMETHDPRRPWTRGYVSYKILRAIEDGAENPDPIHALVQRGAAAYAAVAVPPAPGEHPPFTDMGNGERFSRRWGNEVRYCNELSNTELGGWLTWNGAHWGTDEQLHAQELAKETVRAIAVETPPVVEEKLDKEGNVVSEKNLTTNWATRSEEAPRIRRMLDMGKSIPPIQARAEQFDQHPYLLNVTNGTFDLRDQRLHDHDRTQMLTQCIAVPYDLDATCPSWEAFLLDCMDGDRLMVEFLQVWTGYTLTGDTSEQKMVLHHGEGSNGKSTFLDVLSELLGPYAATAAPTTFLSDGRESAESARPDLATLRGVRHVSAIETNESQTLNEALIKSITGGDQITARHLYRQPFTFRPQFKIALATNQLPVIQGTDYGTWRRVLTCPWPVSFGAPGSPSIDRHLREKLLRELPGILQWAVTGCERWLERGLYIPPQVLDATQDYQESSDVLAPFVDELLVESPEATIPQADLYRVYEAWDTSGKSLSKRNFNNKLPRAFIAKHKRNGVRVWKGIAYSDFGQQISARVNNQGYII